MSEAANQSRVQIVESSGPRACLARLSAVGLVLATIPMQPPWIPPCYLIKEYDSYVYEVIQR